MSQLSVINRPRKRQRHSPQFKQQVVAACAGKASAIYELLPHNWTPETVVNV